MQCLHRGNIYKGNQDDYRLKQEIPQSLAEQAGISVTIVWIPSPVGIIGNEKADQAAKEALVLDLPTKEILLQKDLKNFVKQTIINTWQNLWSQSNTKLFALQPKLTPFEFPPMNRRDRIVIRRLRIGHTRATHGYLMESGFPPVSKHCQIQLTVPYLLIECPHHADVRQRCHINEDLKQNLSWPTRVKSVIKFLKDTNMFESI